MLCDHELANEWARCSGKKRQLYNNKHLMTGPKWNSKRENIEVEGKQNSLFPAGAVIKCFVILPNTKVEKTANKSFSLRRLTHKFAAVSRRTILLLASQKFMLLFPKGDSEFCSP